MTVMEGVRSWLLRVEMAVSKVEVVVEPSFCVTVLVVWGGLLEGE